MPGSHLELVICQWEKWRSIYLQGLHPSSKNTYTEYSLSESDKCSGKKRAKQIGETGLGMA